MKKYCILFLIFISCKETLNKIPNEVKSEKKIVSKNIEIKNKILKSDTLHLERLQKLGIIDYVQINTLQKKFTKDSIGTAFFNFDFIKGNKILKTVPVTIEFGAQEGNWYVNDAVMQLENTGQKEDRFFEFTYGFEACGYTQTNFLFYANGNDFQLVAKNESVADGGYGMGTIYEPVFSKNMLLGFSSKKINLESDETKPYNEKNEDLVQSFSDSIIYRLENNIWIAKPVTPKDKIYRKEFKTFDDLYKQK